MNSIRKVIVIGTLLIVLQLIPVLAAWDYLDKLMFKKPEKYWEIVGKAYAYWGMTMAMNTYAFR